MEDQNVTLRVSRVHFSGKDERIEHWTMNMVDRRVCITHALTWLMRRRGSKGVYQEGRIEAHMKCHKRKGMIAQVG